MRWPGRAEVSHGPRQTELARRGPVWARGCYRINPPRFLAECYKRQLKQGSFVLLYFRLFTFSDLYWVCLSVFSCTVLFIRISQVIGCEDRLRNGLYCVEWGVKLYSNQPRLRSSEPPSNLRSPSTSKGQFSCVRKSHLFQQASSVWKVFKSISDWAGLDLIFVRVVWSVHTVCLSYLYESDIWPNYYIWFTLSLSTLRWLVEVACHSWMMQLVFECRLRSKTAAAGTLWHWTESVTRKLSSP